MKDKALEKEVIAVRQRITELEAAAQEQARRYDEAQREIAGYSTALSAANARLQQEITEREQAEAERKRLLEAERSQAQRQTALLRLSAELGATLDETEVCRRVVNGLHDTLGYDIVALYLVDETTGDRVLAASVGFEGPPTRILVGRGLSERPLLDGRLHYTPDVTQDPHYFYGAGGSEVDVPVRIGGEVLGVLVAERSQRHAFNQDDFDVLTAAAQQAGLAIEKARLLAAERRRADELDALRTTMADITAKLELSVLLQAIVERAAELLNATGGELGLYDEVSREIEIVVSHNMGKNYVGTRMALGDGAMGRVAETGESLILEDYHTWEGRATQYADLRVHAGLAVPLEVGGRLVGVIDVGTTDPDRRFSPADLHLLNLLAQQAAIVIDNARLFEQAQQEIAERQRAEEEAQRRATQAALIYEVGQRVSGELDLDELFSAIVTAISDAFGYYSVALAPVDEEAGYLTIGGIVGGYADVIPPDTRVVIGEGMTGYAAATGETQISGDVSQNPRFVRIANKETKSELVVPIKSGQSVIGVLDLQSEELDAFDQTDVMLIETLADQVAVAIENARLFDQAQQEIAERKKLEEEIRHQKDYFEALFFNNPVAVVTVDFDGNVVAWNPAAEKLFGYAQQEAIGLNVDDLVASNDSIRTEATGYTDQMLIGEQGRVQATTKRTRKDGSMVDVEMRGVPVIVAGERIGFIAIYHDISKLQEARRAAEAANQAKSVFLANMSHELRTPLNAILGFTQLMHRDPNLTTQQAENLGIISRSGEHLLALINDVLEMSKIEAGQVRLQETGFDLHHLLDSLEEMFHLRATDKDLTLSFERVENVPQYVRTDEGKLRQILSNLLGNAVKFTQKGGVVLRVATIPGPEEKETLHFEVEDSGPGIAPEDLVTIFDPFVQATSERDPVSTQPQEGTGLGLSISRQFVRLMGGDITASSELGLGSLFAFDVQVGLAEATEVQAELPARQVIRLEPGQVVYRLLVAEDRETNRQLLVKLLKPLGFEIQEAVNGQEAIEIWERWEPHLIWMDMRMPVVDGYEATRRIKATTKGRDTVIIALTASAFEEDRERVLSEGCDDFVRKPFRKEEIFDVLMKHLGVRFIFDEEPAQPAAATTTDVTASLRAALAALPSDWVADLQQATIKADLSLILTLINRIQGENPVLANALTELANDFEYKKVLMLIEKSEGGDESPS